MRHPGGDSAQGENVTAGLQPQPQRDSPPEGMSVTAPWAAGAESLGQGCARSSCSSFPSQAALAPGDDPGWREAAPPGLETPLGAPPTRPLEGPALLVTTPPHAAHAAYPRA